MWIDTTRVLYVRKGMALSGDLTDGESAVLEPLLPFGRHRKWPLRRLVEAVRYLLRGWLPWRMPPRDFPPMTTVQLYFHAWRDAGPCAGAIDSQNVKTPETRNHGKRGNLRL